MGCITGRARRIDGISAGCLRTDGIMAAGVRDDGIFISAQRTDGIMASGMRLGGIRASASLICEVNLGYYLIVRPEDVQWISDYPLDYDILTPREWMIE